MGDPSALRVSNQRLDSWKEIATFFGRDERTVRRWEKERGLPVHRVPGGGRSGVFAYTDELREWLKGRAEELDSDPAGIRAVPENHGIAVMPTPGLSRSRRRRRLAIWFALSLAVLAGVLVAIWYNHRQTQLRNVQASAHIANAEAQELYLKGEYHWSKRTPDDLNKAVDYFTQSIVKDPSYAPAYVGLADCYNLLREFSVMPPEEAYPRALAAAQKAVELDDNSAGAHNSLAFSTFYWNWDPVTAEREYRRALQLDPNFVQGHHWYATFLLTSGRFPEALDQIEQARKLDPSSTVIQADKGLVLFHAGHKDEAVALLKQLESTDPSLATTHAYLALIYSDRKDYPSYFAELKQAAQLRHDAEGQAVADAAERGFSAGGFEGMRESMLQVQKRFFDQGAGSAYELAATNALLGDKEESLRYLQMAYEKRETGILYLSRDPDFKILHDDPAYQEITGRIEAKFGRGTQR